MKLDTLLSTRPRRGSVIFLTGWMLLTPALPGLEAQQRPAPAAAVERAAEVQTAAQAPVTSDQDASDTRERLEELLRRVPPTVGQALRLDSSLLTNEAYLAPYPALGSFLKQHPEIKSAPRYYLTNIRGEGSYEFRQESTAVQIWRDFIQFCAVAGVMLVIASFLIWIIKTIVESRRWNRMSKVYTEVNNKLLDRFSNNEDLLAYIQTAAGRKFIEASPLQVEAPPTPVGAPLSRILWSVQIGVVLATGALGLLYISNRVVEDVAQLLFALGVLALAVGAGFIVSAAASYILSRQLGLLQPSTPDATRHATTHD